ncbi:MAG TPA: tetratricopeptide repeat protein [Pyrinomonadaceae bacterium]|nr:tetratricopeptide repeat protein [Pyrinomonadaceae bacterium]
MKRVLSFVAASVLLCAVCAMSAAGQRRPAAGKPKPAAAKPKADAAATTAAAGDDAAKAQLEEIVKLEPAERVERLQAFIKVNPKSSARQRAQELLTSARAALGDEKLRTGDRLAGVELFRAAVKGAPDEMPDKLFVEVVSQLPANLYVLGEREAALELARVVESKAKTNASRLLAVAAFYLGVERPEEAARVAAEAARLQPDLAQAHLALAASYRFGLKLDEAAAGFARALELDPKSSAARRSLADLRRATGKPEEALALYRELLQAEPQDVGARAGLVLSLFEAGKRQEAERELEGALMEHAGNLTLLVGAAYWYAARGEGARALELADRAVALEPRYRWVWAHVARARALLALRRPLEAERAIRAARRLGSFATLDYEMANALASAGLFDEAAEQLAQSFTLKGGQIEARLAGRVESRSADFRELLAPERRAGLFQFEGAGGEAEARRMKALLAFRAASAAGGVDEKAAAEAAREFAAGDDEMRAFRDLYAAERLLRTGAAHSAVLERAESAVAGVERALGSPQAPIALFADTSEVRTLRQSSAETGEGLNVLASERDTLSKVMRGRIEELAGWALYGEGRTAEAVVRLRRAVSVLPEGSEWWRTAVWRLGAALEATGSNRDALASYVNAYRALPDPTRRKVIEALYGKLNNGSLKGLDELLEPREVAAARRPTPSPEQPAAETTPTPTPAEVPAEMPTPTPSPAETPTPTPSPSPAETPAPTPEATPAPTPTPTETPAETPAPTPTPSPEQPARRAQSGACVLTVSEPSLTIRKGGSAELTVSLENYTGLSTARIEHSTPNWADIVVLAAPRSAAERTSARFTVNSTSANTGAFNVTFTSPCGKQTVAVNVQ